MIISKNVGNFTEENKFLCGVSRKGVGSDFICR